MPNYHVFAGQRSALRSIQGVVRPAATPSGRGIIQLRLLVRIAIPVMGVAFTVISFIIRQNRVCAGDILIVLPVLLFSLGAGGR